MEPWKRTLYILFAAQLVSAVGFAVFFPFLPLYIHELGTSTGLSLELLAGLVYAGQAFTMAVTSPFWGSLADRHGRKPMVERAMYGGAAIILLMGFARSAEDLVLLRIVQGAVTGTISATNALVAAAAPRDRTGYAMGLLQVGLWGGVAFGPLIGGLIADTLGFRAAFVVTAALLLASGLLVTFGIREEFTPPPPGSRRPSILAEWRRILARPGVAPAYAVRFLNYLGPTLLLPVLPLFVQSILHQSQGVSTFTGLVVGVSSAAGTGSALYLGRFGDRSGHRRVLLATTLAAAVCFVPQFFVTAGWQLLVLQALTGAATGGMGPALSALLARYTPVGEEGVVYGLDNSVSAGARALAPLLGAAVVLVTGLPGVFIAAAAVLLLSALIVLRFPPELPAPQEPRPAYGK